MAARESGEEQRPPGEPWERIRPAPRPVRTAPAELAAGASGAGPAENAEALAAAEAAERELERLSQEAEFLRQVAEGGGERAARPDRARMAPLSLDRRATRQQHRIFHRERKKRRREQQTWRVERGFFLLVLAMLAGVLATAVVFFVRGRHLGNHSGAELAAGATGVRSRGAGAADAAANGPAPLYERASVTLRQFLEARGAEAKSAFVLEAERVLPQMRTCYDGPAAAGLPEDGLTAGVPVPLETGLVTVPCRLDGPDGFVLDIPVRDREGRALLDWETYEQEITRRLHRFLRNPATSLPAAGGQEFRVMLERTHLFGSVRSGGSPLSAPSPAANSGTDGGGRPQAAGEPEMAVTVSAPGSGLHPQQAVVAPELAASLAEGLPWNSPRRALVRLDWEFRPAPLPPRLRLRTVIRWDYVP